jgi:IS30 family transposase
MSPERGVLWVRSRFWFEAREEFFDVLCAGATVVFAAKSAGMSFDGGQSLWRQSGVMGLEVALGRGGGLPGRVPASCPGDDRLGRQRRPLTSEDRAVIAAGVDAQWSQARIARVIGRDRSVVLREIERNKGSDGSYHGAVAHRAAHERRKRPKVFKLRANPGLCRRIEAWMDDGWSPGLIAQCLRAEHLGDDPAAMMHRVSHETIYQALYVQTRGGLRADLNQQLSLQRSRRKERGTRGRGEARMYGEAFTISDRPADVEDRAVPGHWEGDLVMGAGNNSAVGTLVERSTRFTILLHLPGRHDADSVAQAMIREMSKLPEHLRRSITWDRGTELADYERIQLELGTTVFFCDPHSPWQRGSNENTNRLLRFWLKKGSDLSVHTAEDLARIAATLNKRPRPTLDLQTPAQRLATLLSNPEAA